MPHLTVRSRLLILTGAVAAILAGAGGAGLFGVARSNEALRDMYVGRAKALQNISTIDELITQSHYAISDAVLDPSAQKTQSVLEATRRAVGAISCNRPQAPAVEPALGSNTLSWRITA